MNPEEFKSANTIPLEFDQAMQGRGFIKIVPPPIKAIRDNTVYTYYVALTSGGSPTHKIQFQNGILITP